MSNKTNQVSTESTASETDSLPMFVLPDNLDVELHVTSESSVNDRFRSVTTGILKLAGKADKRLSPLSYVVKALWPKSPDSDVWRQLTEQVQKMIDAALAKEEFNKAMGDLQTIYELAEKISNQTSQDKEISSQTFTILMNWSQQSMTQCKQFINVANQQTYSHFYMPITLSVANYHMALLKYIYDLMEKNSDRLNFNPDALLEYGEILDTLEKYELYFSNKLKDWKNWRKKTFTHKKVGADYTYYETKDSQLTGWGYKTCLKYKGLKTHNIRKSKDCSIILAQADSASYNNGVCDLLSSIGNAVYLSKYIPELGERDLENEEYVELKKSVPSILALNGYTAQPQGPVFFAHYRLERKKRGWGANPKFYSDEERWITKISGQAKSHKLALIFDYRDGPQKIKTHSFKNGADLSKPDSISITAENPIKDITVYVKDTFLSALKIDLEDGTSKTLGDTSSEDYNRTMTSPVGFLLHYMETSANSTKSSDDKGVSFDKGIQAIKFRFVNPDAVS